MAPLSFLAAPALLLLAPGAFAQTYAVVDYTKLPSCAKQCSTLTNAESACIPPTQPVTSQNAYQACFCSSSALSGLYSSAQAVCTDVCTSAADQETLKEYYVNLCTSGVVVTPGTSNEAAATTTTTTTGTATGAAATSTATSGAATSSSGGGSWFSSHWKWVLMLIIIFLAMVISSILGVWLKRRIRRKRDAENANVATREAPVLTYGNSRSANGTLPSAQMKETTMSGGVFPPRPPFSTTRSRSNTAGTMSSAYAQANGSATWGPQEYGYSNGEHSGLNKDIGPGVPTPTHPVYMGAGDLPERTYSPVVSPRASTHLNSRPSSRHLQQDNNPNFYSQPGPTYYNENSRPVSPVEETGSRTPIAGAQRIREMQSREHMSRRNSPLSASEEAGGRSNKRLSKKGSRSAS